MRAARREGLREGAAVILHGAVGPEAPPDELDGLAEAASVGEALRRLGWRTEAVALTLDLESGRRRLAEAAPALVFNLVEALAGRGRWAPLAPALLEELELPFTGSPFEPMVYSSNKLLAKRMLLALDVDCPPAWRPRDGAPAEWPGPWIVKPAWEHASVGIDDGSVVPAGRVPGEVARRIAERGGEWFAEGFVAGRELNLTLLEGAAGPELLPPAEILFEGYPPHKPRIVGYAAKWDPGSFEYQHEVRTFEFASTDREMLGRARDVAARCWRALGLAGYARVDMRVDASGRPWVVDVNANPCVTPDSGFVATAERAGLGYDALIARIVEAAQRGAS